MSLARARVSQSGYWAQQETGLDSTLGLKADWETFPVSMGDNTGGRLVAGAHALRWSEPTRLFDWPRLARVKV